MLHDLIDSTVSHISHFFNLLYLYPLILSDDISLTHVTRNTTFPREFLYTTKLRVADTSKFFYLLSPSRDVALRNIIATAARKARIVINVRATAILKCTIPRDVASLR